MSVGVGATGYVGIAPETTPGTYVAPTKFMILRSETMDQKQDTLWRRPLRGIADVHGPVGGNVHVEGDVVCEVTADTYVHVLKAARGDVARTGAGPYVYTYTPNANAVPNKTVSITVVRNGVTFGYTGCVLSSQALTVDNGLLVGTFHFVGRDEASQSLPTPTYPTNLPFSMGQYSIEIPSGSAVTDTDVFTLSINDNAEPQYRLRNTGRTATFIKFGERDVTLDVERDFTSRTEYDAYKTLTSQAVKVSATNGAESIQITLPATIADSYDISGLSGQAELIRASVKYKGVYDQTTSKAASIVVNTAEVLVFP